MRGHEEQEVGGGRNHNMMIISLRNWRINFLGRFESIADQADDVGLECVQS